MKSRSTLGEVTATGLTTAERAALGSLCGHVDVSRVHLHRGRTGRIARGIRVGVLRISGNRAVALGNHVFLPDSQSRDIPTLAHELMHCGQRQEWGLVTYLARALVDRGRELLHVYLGVGRGPYYYSGESGRPFRSFGMEQQGQIVEDCFRGNLAARRLSPYGPPERADNAAAAPTRETKSSTSASVVSKDVIQRTSDLRSSHT